MEKRHLILGAILLLLPFCLTGCQNKEKQENSNTENTIILIKNSFVFLPLNFFNVNMINTAPNPYIGHTGPYKNPLFTNFPNTNNANIVSKIHPKNEYITKYNTNFCISFNCFL